MCLARRQLGVGMIDAMVALVVFSFGLIALADFYMNGSTAPDQNLVTASVQVAATSFFTDAGVDSSVLPLSLNNVSTASGMPDAEMSNWFSQAQQNIPGLSVSVISGPDGAGNACSTTSCGLTLTISWTQMGQTRSQVFYGQAGFK